jgi:hypothetical protein
MEEYIEHRLADTEKRLTELVKLVEQFQEKNRALETKADLFKSLHETTHKEISEVQLKCASMEAEMGAYINAVHILNGETHHQGPESFSRQNRGNIPHRLEWIP